MAQAAHPDSRERSTGSHQAAALGVLIVEDLPRVQSLLFELIHEPGHLEVLAITDTESDAIEQFEALAPDAVIVDLSLRQGSGLGVIAALRRGQHARRPLLIVLTNHAMSALKAACMGAGADHYLDKSRDFHKVRPLLERARVEMLRAGQAS